MKKITIIILAVFICSTNLYSKGYEDYNLENISIPEGYLGTYIPVEYEDLLIKYNSHEKALLEIKNKEYTVLFLKKDICTSILAYNDGFAIKKEFVNKWKFSTDGFDKVIIDQNGYSYRKVSEEIVDTCQISNYIMKLLLKDFLNENLEVKDDFLIINNNKYKFRLSPCYVDKSVAFMVLGIEPFFIIIEDCDLKLVGSDRINSLKYEPNDEIFYECKRNKHIN